MVGDRVVDRGRGVPLAEEAVGFVGFVEVDWGCGACCCFGVEGGEGGELGG